MYEMITKALHMGVQQTTTKLVGALHFLLPLLFKNRKLTMQLRCLPLMLMQWNYDIAGEEYLPLV